MRLYLVRHGRTASNVAGLLDTAYPGAPLDDEGQAQADALVERFEGRHVDAVYASDIHRAVQTATPLATARGLEVNPHAGLREILAGDQEMLAEWGPYVAVLQAWGEGRWSERRPGGEDADTFFGRFDAAVAAIASAGHDAALLVSHGAALRMWVGGRVAGVAPEQVAVGRLGNTAVLTVDGAPGDWTLVDWDAGAVHRVPQDPTTHSSTHA